MAHAQPAKKMKKNKQIIAIQFALTCDCSFQQITAVKNHQLHQTILQHNSLELRSFLREGLQTFHKASNSVCVQKPALISNEGNSHLFGSRSVFEVLQYNH